MPFHWQGTNIVTSDAQDPVARIPEYKMAVAAAHGGEISRDNFGDGENSVAERAKQGLEPSSTRDSNERQ